MMSLDNNRFTNTLRELNEELNTSRTFFSVSRSKIPALLEKLKEFNSIWSEMEVRKMIDSVRESITNKTPKEQKEICQKTLIEIAKYKAKDLNLNHETIKEYVLNRDTAEGQKTLVEIAISAAKHSGGATSRYIQSFGINASTEEGQKALIEIAKIAAKNDIGMTSKYIQNYGINASTAEGQQALIEIAKIAAQNGASYTSQYIQNYSINASTAEGQQALIEIAKITAEIDGEGTSEFIQNYGIEASTEEGQKALIEIAKIAAERTRDVTWGGSTAQYIQNYGIKASTEEGQKALIEIAKITAEKDGGGTSQHIQNYGINASTTEGQKALIEIAKIAAQQNPARTSPYIKNYGINASSAEGQQTLIEIAKLAAKKDGGATSQYIQKYGINASTAEGQKALIEIAKLAAQQNGGETSKYIQNYGINASTAEGQKALIEIAKLAAQHNGASTSEFIQNYGINASTEDGQKALIEIAKLAAQHNGASTSYYIQNYGIDGSTAEGQKGLIEIAKVAAQAYAWDISDLIRKFNIRIDTEEGQQGMIEIAKLAAQYDGQGTSFHIQNYGIDGSTKEGQKGLIEIAKIAVTQNVEGTSEFIQNYGIDGSTEEGQKGLIAIAKCAAQQDGVATSNLISNYKIRNDEQGHKGLIEIAKVAMRQNAYKVAPYLPNYGINADTPEGQKELVDIWISKEVENGNKTHVDLGIDWRHPNLDENLKTSIREIFKKIWLNDPNLLKQLDAILEVADKTSPLFLSVLNFLVSISESLDLPSTLKIIKEAYSFKDPALCATILTSLMKFNSAQPALSKLMQENNALVYVLPNFYLAILQAQGVDCKKVIKDLKNMKEWLKDVFFQKNLLTMLDSLKTMGATQKGFRLDPQDVQTLLENTMCIPKELAKTQGLTKEELKEVHEKEKQKKSELKKELRSAYQAVRVVITLKASELLRGVKDLDGYSQALEKAFRENLPALKDIPNFGVRFSETFGRFRDPTALFVYNSDLQRLPTESIREKMLNSLAGCIEDVLNNKFPACRYTGSLHLDTVFKGRATLEEAWKKGAQKPFLEIAQNDKGREAEKEEAIDFGKLLLGSFDEGHVESSAYPELYQYLKEPEKRTTIGEDIKQKLQDPQLEKEDKRKLLFEQSLIDLAGNPDNPEKDLQRAIELLPTKSQKGYSSQFDADIRGLLKSLEEKKTLEEKSLSSAKWTIVDTDDLCDLFLCGTEVMGSCQKIGGDPDYNKCLLAYVMDGKNRLLAIKDEKGQIKARAILRILLNGEKEPILFMERVYPKLIAPELENALREMAHERSLALRVPLALEGKEISQRSAPLLSSLSGKDYEYVDAGDGVTNGVFTIYNSHYMEGTVGIGEEVNSLREREVTILDQKSQAPQDSVFVKVGAFFSNLFRR